MLYEKLVFLNEDLFALFNMKPCMFISKEHTQMFKTYIQNQHTLQCHKALPN